MSLTASCARWSGDDMSGCLKPFFEEAYWLSPKNSVGGWSFVCEVSFQWVCIGTEAR